MKTTRVVSALLVALLIAGPLASLADAQQPTQPAAPAAPAAPGAQAPAPDLFQETLRAEQGQQQSSAYDAGAIAVNAFLVPGRAITCMLGGAAGFLVLVATLGTGYQSASEAVHEGCGGKWAVNGDDLRPHTAAGRPVDLYMEQQH
jgi:hypothetical protein